jgi:hypothetical protein
VDRADFLLDLATDRRVLHVGCTNAPYTSSSLHAGSLLHDRLAAVADVLVGVDVDRAGLDQLSEHGHKRLIHIDNSIVEKLSEIPPVDLIIAGEVIEHVDDAGAFLLSLRSVMLRDDAELVLTTVNAYCALRALQYAWPRSGPLSEPVHPDHVAYYSLRTLELLCDRQGLTAHDRAFYDIGAEHRSKLPRHHQLANDLAVRWLPQLADGIVIRCRVAREPAW